MLKGSVREMHKENIRSDIDSIRNVHFDIDDHAELILSGPSGCMKSRKALPNLWNAKMTTQDSSGVAIPIIGPGRVRGGSAAQPGLGRRNPGVPDDVRSGDVCNILLIANALLMET
jgi:hypothetical protein